MNTSIATTVVQTNETQIAMGTKSGRFLVGVIPAGVVTVGLFLGMRALIEIDDFTPNLAPSHKLIAYYVPEFGNPTTVRTRKPLKRPEALPPPRIAPPVAKVTSTIFTLPGFKIPEPRLRKAGRPFKMTLGPVAINNRNLRPLQPPMVVYPQSAISRGLEGSCEVSLDVTPRGRPYNVKATCTHRVFVDEAERAVSKVEFQPGIYRGQPTGVEGVVYPLEFQIED